MPATVTDRITGLTTSVAVKAPCKVATNANITLSGLQTVNGVVVADGDRVLVKDQTSSAQNGIYVVHSTAWSRSLDFDGNRDVVQGTLVVVSSATVSETIYRVTTANPITIGTSAIVFVQSVFGSLDSLGVSFIQAGTGAVTRTGRDKWRDFVSVKDFGAVGDGATDDTAAIQLAINTKKNVYFPAGRYLVTNTLTFVAVGGGPTPYSGVLWGAGNGHIAGQVAGVDKVGTVIVTPNNFNKALFSTHGSRTIHLRDMSLVGPGKGYSGSIAFWFNTLNRYCLFENLDIFGWETGFQVGDPSTFAQGNDSENYFDHVFFEDTTYCYRCWNSQAYGNIFHGCVFDTNTDYACKSEAGGGYSGAMLKTIGCFMGSGIGVFYELSTYGHVVCEGCHFENGAPADPPYVFYSSAGGTQASFGLTVTGCQFLYNDSRYYATTVPFIKMNGSGPLCFTGNKVEMPNAIVEIPGFQAHFSGNNWRWQPDIRLSSSNPNPPQYTQIGDSWIFYNGRRAQSVDVAVDRIFQPISLNGFRTFMESAIPTTGSWRQGDVVENTNASSTGPIRWRCTSFPGGTFGTLVGKTATTTSGSAVATFNSVSGLVMGQYVAIVGVAGAKQIVSIASLSVTFDTTCNASVVAAAVSYSPPTMKAEVFPGVGAANGDAGATLTWPASEETQIWTSAFTGDHAVTLSTTGAINGAKFHIVRAASATGASNLNVGTGPLKALAVGTWCIVQYNGSAWVLMAYGAL